MLSYKTFCNMNGYLKYTQYKSYNTLNFILKHLIYFNNIAMYN